MTMIYKGMIRQWHRYPPFDPDPCTGTLAEINARLIQVGDTFEGIGDGMRYSAVRHGDRICWYRWIPTVTVVDGEEDSHE